MKPVHRRKLRSIFNFGQYSQVCPRSTSGSAEQAAHLPLQAAPCGLSSLAGACLPLTASTCGDGPGRCSIVLILNQPQACPAFIKGGVTTLKERPYGHVGLRWVVPVPGILALPRTRHCQVILGVVPHDRFARPERC